MKRLLYILGIFAMAACSRYPRDVERALKYAGDNRTELENVLEHYGKNPGDGLKYKAAEYLVKNMPNYHHIHWNIDSINYRILELMVGSNISQEQALDILKKKHPGSFAYKSDIEIISSSYLINNIDKAFKVWEESPWGKDISFDHFCKEILPYRVGSEPLEEWRENYYNHFKPVLDSLSADDSPLTACRILHDMLIKKRWRCTTKSFVNLGANILLNIDEAGHCDTHCQMMTFAMRSLGIPGGIDCYPVSPNKMGGGHSWNYLRNTTGEIVHFDFEPCDAGYVRDTTWELVNYHFDPHRIEKLSVARKKGKVYRNNPGYKGNKFPVKFSELPPTIQHISALEDVSFEYFGKNPISLSIKDTDQKIAFLCVFNDKKWIPVDYMEIKNGKAKLNVIESDVVFIPGFFKNNEIVTVGHPFFYDGEKLNYFIADSSNLEKVALTRKYSFSVTMERLKKYAIGGKFQVANNANFSDARTIHEITKEADMVYNTVTPDMHRDSRFVRYLSAENGFCCMAELEFYSQENELLTGRVIGTEGTRWGVEAHNKYAVFDKDPLTYFISKEPSGAWTGLDLETPKRIGKIRYLFRNDDNSIRPGDIYELFYFTPAKWVSCGQKQGQDSVPYLEYDNVPKNALFWLQNHTRGNEERIFSYNDNKQVWW